MLNVFKSAYNRGFDDGQSKGWDEGFEIGSKKALAESKRVFVKLIKEEIMDVSSPMMVNKEFLDGLERAIEIIRKKR